MTLEKWLISPGESRTIDLGLIRSLKVALVGGHIDVIAHDEETARVEVHAVRDRPLQIDVSGDRLGIDHPQLGWDNLLGALRSLKPGGSSADISVLVPRGTNVSLGTLGAGVLIAGVSGELKLNTTTGEVQVDRSSGRIDVNTVSGEVTVQDHRGSINLNTMTGDATLSGALERVDIDTVSGDVFLDAYGQLERLSSNAVSGALTARLDPNLGARYLLNSVSGTLSLDGALVPTSIGRAFTSVTHGDGTFFTEIRANSVAGRITVFRRTASGEAAADSASTADASAADNPPGSAPEGTTAESAAAGDAAAGDSAEGTTTTETNA